MDWTPASAGQLLAWILGAIALQLFAGTGWALLRRRSAGPQIVPPEAPRDDQSRRGATAAASLATGCGVQPFP